MSESGKIKSAAKVLFRALFVVTTAMLTVFLFAVVLLGLLYATAAAWVAGLLIVAFGLMQYPIFRLLTRLGLLPNVNLHKHDSRV